MSERKEILLSVDSVAKQVINQAQNQLPIPKKNIKKTKQSLVLINQSSYQSEDFSLLNSMIHPQELSHISQSSIDQGEQQVQDINQNCEQKIKNIGFLNCLQQQFKPSSDENQCQKHRSIQQIKKYYKIQQGLEKNKQDFSIISRKIINSRNFQYKEAVELSYLLRLHLQDILVCLDYQDQHVQQESFSQQQQNSLSQQQDQLNEVSYDQNQVTYMDNSSLTQSILPSQSISKYSMISDYPNGQQNSYFDLQLQIERNLQQNGYLSSKQQHQQKQVSDYPNVQQNSYFDIQQQIEKDLQQQWNKKKLKNKTKSIKFKAILRKLSSDNNNDNLQSMQQHQQKHQINQQNTLTNLVIDNVNNNQNLLTTQTNNNLKELVISQNKNILNLNQQIKNNNTLVNDNILSNHSVSVNLLYNPNQDLSNNSKAIQQYQNIQHKNYIQPVKSQSIQHLTNKLTNPQFYQQQINSQNQQLDAIFLQLIYNNNPYQSLGQRDLKKYQYLIRKDHPS